MTKGYDRTQQLEEALEEIIKLKGALDYAKDKEEKFVNELMSWKLKQPEKIRTFLGKDLDYWTNLEEQNDRLRESQQWKSIDSAPRDGTRIIVNGKYGASCAHYNNGWFAHSWLNREEAPTHWMPLPEPPKGDL